MNFVYRPEIFDFISKHEGNVLRAYRDTVGKWTIGRGITDPRYAFEGNVITEAESARLAREYILRDIEECNRLIKVPTTSDQQTAILSLCYNIGMPRFSSSTLLRKLNSGDYEGAHAQFMRWNKETDPVTKQLRPNRGLTNRRADEAALFLRGTQAMAREEKRDAEELVPDLPPPAYSNVEPATPPDSSSKAKVAGGVAATAGALSQVSQVEQVRDAVAPLASFNEYLGMLFVGVSLLAIWYMLKKGD
jgi:lysozyme